MKSFLALLAALAVAGVVAGAAGAGTIGTAVPAGSVTFDGTYTAKFVQSASGLVMETNRINSAGPQNPWTSLDVWLQFRPLAGKPNPACDATSPSFVTSFLWHTPTMIGAYFEPSTVDNYNVCVYLVHAYGVDLSVAPTPVVRGGSVVFTSHLLTDGVPDGTTPATVQVHAYGLNDSTCSTEEAYGPFSTTKDGTKYVTDPKTASAAPGDYYYKAEATVGSGITFTRWSSCTKLTIWPVVTADLSADPNPVVVDNTVVFTSHVNFDGVADITTPAANVKVHAFGTDSTCTGSEPWGPFDTSVSGDGYVTAALPVTLTGTYYYETVADTAYSQFKSGCTALVITPHVYSLSLLGDGMTTLAVDIGHHITYSGQALLDGNPVEGAAVNLAVFAGFGCVTSLYPVNPAGLTDSSGDYSLPAGPSPEGFYSVQATTTNATSNCIDITVGDHWSLDLLIEPSSLTSGETVTFSGTLGNQGPSSVDGRTVTIVGYGTDNTCTTPVWGPWTPTTDGSGHYTTGPLGTGAAPADYYYQATSMGTVSGCEHFTITG